MRQDVLKAYEAKEIEARWYPVWENRGYFRADASDPASVFSIVLPPPNVTGKLHMGHALNMTLHDILSRWKRMQGFNTLWLPGTDHAGIATQNVVERQLAEEGLTRKDLGRDAFEKRVWKWKEIAQNNILNQIRRLGCSCDWSRQRFTLDEGLSVAVREVFVRLYESGLIYQGEYLVNWCPRCTTAISDLEVEYHARSGKLWYIKYPLSGNAKYMVVATTRPETMLGDTAVAVHPEDDRYRELIGRTCVLPLMEREIPVIADEAVDREFGSGAVKVTPGHDPNDFEMGRRHDLPVLKVIGDDGRMTEAAGPYAGQDRFEARRNVIGDLKARDLLLKIEDHAYNVGHCQRCDTIVEPLVSKQWFVKVKELADPAIKAVEEGRTHFTPENFEKIYFDWMHKIHDWCISRQLWWGHRIPAWYCKDCGHITVARQDPSLCSRCGKSNLEQESDVLDTWFSSALWPFSTLGWPQETDDLKTYYPTSLLVTGFDIIFFWVARMIMMGLRFMDDVPFRQVYINGLVKDEKGQKMSKSRGNIIDPLELIDEYGADAIRFTLAVMAVPGTDIPFSVSRMAGYRAFCNKIWNAVRFLLLNLKENEVVSADQIQELWKSNYLRLEDRWILGRLQEVIERSNENLGKFRFHETSNELYHFFWHELCDWYIELIKARITAEGDEAVRTARVAVYVLDVSLRLLHPFMPFITEELWQRLPHRGESIMLSEFPRPITEWIEAEAIKEMEQLQELIREIRTARAENNIDPRKKIPVRIRCETDAGTFLESQRHHLETLARLDGIEFVEHFEPRGVSVQGVTPLAEFSLLLDDVIDLEQELNRLNKQVLKLKEDVSRLERKLQNASFIEKAPPEVVEAARQRHGEGMETLKILEGKARLLQKRTRESESGAEGSY